jgi:hypothetical protein
MDIFLDTSAALDQATKLLMAANLLDFNNFQCR